MFKFVENNKLFIQIVLGLVALTFVGFGVSSYTAVSSDPYLVKVGNTDISLRDVDRALDGQAINQASREQALQGLIQRNLILQAAQQDGLKISDTQLRQAIAAIPAFQDNGQFSADKYKAYLDSRQMTGPQFEVRITSDLLVQRQLDPIVAGQVVSVSLRDHVASILGQTRQVSALLLTPQSFASQVKVDDAAIAAFYKANPERFKAPDRVKLSYVILSQNQLAQNIKVTDQAVSRYYQQNQAQFSPEERSASHILLTVPANATPAEDARIKAAAGAILKQVRAHPDQFAELARKDSQDPGSAAKGGALGFFARGVMVKPFDEAVFSLKPGQISDLVRTQYGYHIIKLDAIRKPSFEEVQSAVTRQLQQSEAASQYRKQSETLNEVSYQQGDSLKGVENALHLPVLQSDWLTRAPTGNDPVLSNPKVLAAAFSDDVLRSKHNSEPVDVGNNTLVVVRVTAYQPAHPLTLDEVREQIRSELVATGAGNLAVKKGKAMLAQLKAGKQDAQAGGWSQVHSVSRQNTNGLPPASLQAIFAANTKKLPAYIGLKMNDGGYVLYRIDKLEAAPALDAQQSAQLTGLIANMDGNAQLAAYLNALRQQFPVKAGTQQLAQTQE